MYVLFLFFLLFCSSIISDNIERKLVLAQLVFRHSNRTPIAIYKNSPCQIDVYEDGLGAITNDGLKKAREYGKILRDRFFVQNKNFLSGNYYKEIFVRSTAMDRCIQTVQAILSSFYETKGSRYAWNDDFDWYPFPLHIEDMHKDPELRSESSPCPKLHKITKQRAYGNRIRNFLQLHSTFLDKIRSFTGIKVTEYELWDLYQTLQIEWLDSQSKNPICGKIPSWLNESILSELERITSDFLNIYYDPTPHRENEKDYRMLIGGPLLKILVSNIHAHMMNNSRVKLFMYSAHDSTVYSLLSVLGITWPDYVQYLTTISVEMYQVGSKYEIEVFLYDSKNTKIPFTKISMPYCPYPCTVEDFIKNYSNVISEDREKECKLIEEDKSCDDELTVHNTNI